MEAADFRSKNYKVTPSSRAREVSFASHVTTTWSLIGRESPGRIIAGFEVKIGPRGVNGESHYG
jgi:hypothetical protein